MALHGAEATEKNEIGNNEKPGLGCLKGV